MQHTDEPWYYYSLVFGMATVSSSLELKLHYGFGHKGRELTLFVLVQFKTLLYASVVWSVYQLRQGLCQVPGLLMCLSEVLVKGLMSCSILNAREEWQACLSLSRFYTTRFTVHTLNVRANFRLLTGTRQQCLFKPEHAGKSYLQHRSYPKTDAHLMIGTCWQPEIKHELCNYLWTGHAAVKIICPWSFLDIQTSLFYIL